LGKEISVHITYKLSEEIPMVTSFTVSVNISKKQTEPPNKFSNSTKKQKRGGDKPFEMCGSFRGKE
jgi:hypothetical protein